MRGTGFESLQICERSADSIDIEGLPISAYCLQVFKRRLASSSSMAAVLLLW